MRIKEIGKNWLEKRASETGKDHREAPSREDSCKSPRLIEFLPQKGRLGQDPPKRRE